ncbi:hypothetical protein ncot_11490 [Nocardioides sp. JQ2195]|uniref:hypothetical protein n=1 Tax=Nocardioides sp. JQ2195 TaxID=2592334 RepID=UPI00143E3E6F|nr:hypothetical protein [Nocardioides sp. JQ2195]QIX27150.1 hypothetical protein ncot_11490 [Nocardioides sp. JQ2195]
MRCTRDLVGLLLVTVLACGCGTSSDSDDEEEGMSDATSGPRSPGQGSSPSGSGTLPPEQQEAVDDLAERQGIAADDVEVVRVQDVTWRDGSLGCAEPGRMYTQALVEGRRIVLAAGGAEFEYHSGGSRAPFLCENPTQ